MFSNSDTNDDYKRYEGGYSRYDFSVNGNSSYLRTKDFAYQKGSFEDILIAVADTPIQYHMSEYHFENQEQPILDTPNDEHVMTIQ